MPDIADLGNDHIEREAEGLIAQSRQQEGPVATGRCIYCDEIVRDLFRWCDADCRKAWDQEVAAMRRAGQSK